MQYFPNQYLLFADANLCFPYTKSSKMRNIEWLKESHVSGVTCPSFSLGHVSPRHLDIYFKLINVYLYARKEKENNKNINATGYFSEVTSLSQCPTGHRYHHHTSFAFSNNSRLLVILALPKVLTFVIYFHFVKLFPCQQFGIQ